MILVYMFVYRPRALIQPVVRKHKALKLISGLYSGLDITTSPIKKAILQSINKQFAAAASNAA